MTTQEALLDNVVSNKTENNADLLILIAVDMDANHMVGDGSHTSPVKLLQMEVLIKKIPKLEIVHYHAVLNAKLKTENFADSEF
jgi:hypothetical protein